MKNCLVCKKEFKPWRKTTVYCSNICSNAPRKTPLFENDCKQCGKHFISRLHVPYVEKNPDKTPNFCSRRCMFDSRSKPKAEFTCEMCGKVKQIHQSSLVYHTNRFCSKTCGGKFYTSERAQRWKGGVTSENMKIRHSTEYKAWKLAVFYRDGKKCVWCGSKKNIEADHIKPFALFPELRMELSNGRTLCHECHMATESYKNHKLTRADFL